MKSNLSIAFVGLVSALLLSSCATSEGVTEKDGSPGYAKVLHVDLGNGESVVCVSVNNSVSCDWDNKVVSQ